MMDERFSGHLGHVLSPCVFSTGTDIFIVFLSLHFINSLCVQLDQRMISIKKKKV